MSDFYDNMLASIEALNAGYWGSDEAVIEHKIEKFFDRLDKAYMRHEITDEEYDELSLELGVAYY